MAVAMTDRYEGMTTEELLREVRKHEEAKAEKLRVLEARLTHEQKRTRSAILKALDPVIERLDELGEQVTDPSWSVTIRFALEHARAVRQGLIDPVDMRAAEEG